MRVRIVEAASKSIGKKCQQVFICSEAEPVTEGPSSLETAKRAATQVASAAGGLLRVAGQLVTRLASESISVPEPALSPALAKLIADGQDLEKTSHIVERVQQILITGEDVRYVAVQAKPVMNLFPDAIVLTNRRFIAYHPKMLNRVD